MKIAIISDVHNNLINLKKVLDYCASEKIEKIICCGDLASLEKLDFLNDNFEGEIYFVFGNMDNDFLRDKFCHSERSVAESRNLIRSFDSSAADSLKMTCNYKQTKIFQEFGEAEIENKKIAFVHKPEPAKELCATGKYKFVFYGHTHKPWEENIDGCKMLNPGNVAGDIFLATFAVWNTEDDKFELIRINNLK